MLTDFAGHLLTLELVYLHLYCYEAGEALLVSHQTACAGAVLNVGTWIQTDSADLLGLGLGGCLLGVEHVVEDYFGDGVAVVVQVECVEGLLLAQEVHHKSNDKKLLLAEDIISTENHRGATSLNLISS